MRHLPKLKFSYFISGIFMILVLHFLKAYIKLNEIVIVTQNDFWWNKIILPIPIIIGFRHQENLNECLWLCFVKDIMRTLWCVRQHACAGDAHQRLLHSGCYHSNNQPWGPNTWRPASEVSNVQNQCLIVRLFVTLTHSFLYNAHKNEIICFNLTDSLQLPGVEGCSLQI